MKRADLAKRRFVIHAASRAAMWYHPADRPEMSDAERIDLAMGGICHDALNGCGGGIGRATARAAAANWDAWRAEVAMVYPECLAIETRNRAIRTASAVRS